MELSHFTFCSCSFLLFDRVDDDDDTWMSTAQRHYINQEMSSEWCCLIPYQKFNCFARPSSSSQRQPSAHLTLNLVLFICVECCRFNYVKFHATGRVRLLLLLSFGDTVDSFCLPFAFHLSFIPKNNFEEEVTSQSVFSLREISLKWLKRHQQWKMQRIVHSSSIFPPHPGPPTPPPLHDPWVPIANGMTIFVLFK